MKKSFPEWSTFPWKIGCVEHDCRVVRDINWTRKKGALFARPQFCNLTSYF
jgi:hypothetical protein